MQSCLLHKKKAHMYVQPLTTLSQNISQKCVSLPLFHFLVEIQFKAPSHWSHRAALLLNSWHGFPTQITSAAVYASESSHQSNNFSTAKLPFSSSDVIWTPACSFTLWKCASPYTFTQHEHFPPSQHLNFKISPAGIF